MTIERFYQNYVKSNGIDQAHRYAILGLWTVDLKKQIMFLSEEPDKVEQHRLVLRSNSHKRVRVDTLRFSSPVDTGFKEFRNLVFAGDPKKDKTNEQANWVGRTWFKKINNEIYPSLMQIEEGLLAEAMEQLSLEMMNVKSGQVHIDAKHNI